MRNEIIYEWCVETTNEHGDIIEIDYFDKLSDIDKNDTIVLVRTEGNDADGLTDRYWAYVKAGKLPEKFSNEMGELTSFLVPKRFHREFESQKKNN